MAALYYPLFLSARESLAKVGSCYGAGSWRYSVRWLDCRAFWGIENRAGKSYGTNVLNTLLVASGVKLIDKPVSHRTFVVED